jgi:prolyl-tRNA synthetase
MSAVRLGGRPAEPEAPLPAEDVETPHCKTIADLAAYLGIPAARTAKALFLSTYSPAQGERLAIAIVRGDTALDEQKLLAALGVDRMGPATEDEIRAMGAEPGYGSPVGLSGVTVVVDTLAAATPNLVAGANRPGYHTLNVNLGRDYQASLVADVAGAQDGSPCPHCGSPLLLGQGAALAELRNHGTGPAQTAGAQYLNEAGQSQPLTLGAYRVHVDRLLAAIAECHNDGKGLAWPPGVAPFDVHMVTMGKANAAVDAAAARLSSELEAAGLAVLLDDRDERAGVKFNDADLLGVPLRVVVGDRGLQSGTVEVKHRSQAEAGQVKLEELVDYARRS